MSISDSPAGSEADASRLDEIRRRYRDERSKRIREEGVRQFTEVAGEFAQFDIDPYVEPGFTRDPLGDEVEVAIVGGGWGGLLVGARLREAGVEGIRIIEKGGDFGGTWYWNRYPGAQCDIESYIYLPLLEEMGYVPSEKYVHGPEIFAYAQKVGKQYGLYEDACFQTDVTEIAWDDEQGHWIISTDRSDQIRARFVILTSGLLTKPKLPGIPGITDFQGKMFHTSRFDYGYTGGGPEGGLNKLTDKRVGLIGTGATAIQLAPYLAESAEHLYIFQRTPSVVLERRNRPTDPQWAESLTPGWAKRRMANFNLILNGGQPPEDLVDDLWTYVSRGLGMPWATEDGEQPSAPMDDIARVLELRDLEMMDEVRSRVATTVTDSDTAESLKPWYRLMCKRPCFHDGYLPMFNRPNVTLIDSEGRGVDRITRTGVVVNGVEVELDCLIFATGFEVGTAYTERQGYDVIGKNGVTHSAKFVDGMRTYQGFHSHDFPNMLYMGCTQTGFTTNLPHMLNEQAEHIAWLIARCNRDGVTRIEATADAELAWCQIMDAGNEAVLEFLLQCTPGYFNNEGRPTETNALRRTVYPPGAEAFFELVAQWRESGSYEGLDVGPAVAALDDDS